MIIFDSKERTLLHEEIAQAKNLLDIVKSRKKQRNLQHDISVLINHRDKSAKQLNGTERIEFDLSGNIIPSSLKLNGL